MGKMKEKDIEFLNGYYSEDEDMGADSYTEKEIDTDVPEERNGLYSNEILEKIIGVNRINYYPKNYSIDWLVDRLGSGKFSMPKYQRKYVWLDHQVTALIVSVLKKIPIPKLYGYYTESQGSNQTTLIIDGQQRVTTFTILACVIRDLYYDILDEKQKDYIKLSIQDKYENTKRKLKFLTNDKYQLDFEETVLKKINFVSNKNDYEKDFPKNRYLQNAHFIRDNIKENFVNFNIDVNKFVIWLYEKVVLLFDKD
mgnify:CR=1 FL=1